MSELWSLRRLRGTTPEILDAIAAAEPLPATVKALLTEQVTTHGGAACKLDAYAHDLNNIVTVSITLQKLF